MKFCEITDANAGLFDQYIPARFASCKYLKRDHKVLGLYETVGKKTKALGACVIYVYDGTAEILSLTYNKNYLVGVPEQELTELILQQDWDLYRILYITNGTKKELEEYDYLMMDIGYASSPGDVKRYHATLADIMHKQNKSIMTRMKKAHSIKYLSGRELTPEQLRFYNEKFPLLQYTRCPENENLSCFLIKDDMPQAGIEVLDQGDGILEFAWMNKGDLSTMETMDMIIHLITTAINIYDTKAEVVICPYQEEVIHIMERFGFKPDPKGNDTRIYTYYI